LASHWGEKRKGTYVKKNVGRNVNGLTGGGGILVQEGSLAIEKSLDMRAGTLPPERT